MKKGMRALGVAGTAILLPLGAAGQEAAITATSTYSEMTYRAVGPSRGGRVTTVAGHVAQPSTFYMGATGGGVWKTTDYGANWRPVSDGYLATGSIGSIAVADSDPDVVYVGTGSDGLRSNVIIGKGVYRSTDGGETWAHVGLEQTGNIGAVIVHPGDPDVVLVAAIGNPFAPTPDRGVYRTTDGGASWEQVLFVSDSTGAVDLEFAPDNPQEIYATFWRAERKPWTIISGAREGGVYKSSDGGSTWAHLSEGLPAGLRGKADLAVSPADPDRVYVLMEAPPGEGGLYRSDDRGGSWRLVSTYEPLLERPFYYINITADPTDADILYSASEDFVKSTDGGASWTEIPTPHGDNHDLWINPEHPRIMIESNDGGANVTLDGGATWSTQHNQPTAELYQVNTDDRFVYRLYAGQQDNTTIGVPSRQSRDLPGGWTANWVAIGGCETGPAVPKPGDPDIVYANCKGRFGLYNARTDQEQQFYVGMRNIYGHDPDDLPYRFQRVAPIAVSPHDADVVYHGSQYLHRTTDGGRSWVQISPDLTARDPATQVPSGMPINRDITGEEYHSTLYAIAESPVQRGVIWVGANDGPIHVSRDDGANWTEVTPPELGPHGRVQTVEPSPHRAGKAYAAVLRYQLGDFAPYIFRTDDFGESWVRLTPGDNGIPGDHPTRVVREDPDREGLLYAGTEFGMFLSFDDGETWQSFQQNLPVTPVTDLKVYRQDLVLSTMGRGFWVMDDVTPLHEASEALVSDAHLFTPRPAYRVRSGGFGSGDTPTAEPQYPEEGAVLNYYLAERATGPITIEVLDRSGAVVQRFSSTDAAPQIRESQEMRAPVRERIGGPRLSVEPGMHRITWNLRTFAPEGRRSSRASGPMVPPGLYRVRLAVERTVQARDLEIRMDPRVTAEGITAQDVTDQYVLALEVGDALGEARAAAAELERVGGETPLSGRLAEIHRAMVTEDRQDYPTPMLVDQLSYLYNNLNSADQPPGRDAYEQYERLRAELDGFLLEIRTLTGWETTSQP